jgi:hypothetical protein
MLWWLLISCASNSDGLKRPNHMIVGPDHTLYVNDLHHHRLAHFTAEGRFIRQIGTAGVGIGHLWAPAAMAFDGNELLVVDRALRAEGGTWVVKRFDNGKEVGSTSPVQATTRLHYDSMVAHPDGGFVVADRNLPFLVRWSADWSEHKEFGPQQAFYDLAVGDDELWGVAQSDHQIYRMDVEGNLLQVIGRQGVGDGELDFPVSVTVCPQQGWAAVADLGNHRVVRFTLDGHFMDSFAPAPVSEDVPVQLMHIARAADCSELYLVDSKGNRVLRTTPEGKNLGSISRW